MRRPDEGNPRPGYVGIDAMISDTRVEAAPRRTDEMTVTNPRISA